MSRDRTPPPSDERGPSLRLIAEVLAEGSTRGLYDRADLVDWALGVIEREPEPPIAIIDLAMSSRLDDSDTAALVRDVPGELRAEAVRGILVGIVARGVAAGHVDPRSAARVLYALCLDAPGELGQLAAFDDDFYFAEDGVLMPEDVAAALRARLRTFEHLAEGLPLSSRWPR
jgi:hypothetical protein